MKKVVLLALSAVSMAFAQGDLWGPSPSNFPSLQVRVPQAIECNANNPPEDCYSTTGGWWYGYKFVNGLAEVKLANVWTNFQDVPLTDEMGGSLISGAIEVRLTAAGDGTDYGGAGVGFDFKADKSGQNIQSLSTGYCITYTSDAALEFKLGHNETTYDDGCTRQFMLPARSTPGAVSLTWSQFAFPGWCAGASRPKPIVPEAVPLTDAVAVKIATPSQQENTPATYHINIYQFGWGNTCNNDVSVSIKPGSAAASVNFKMVGRSFTLNSIEKPVAVQVINLQGAVVYSQTLTSANKTMNLSNLPTGVYMLRAPDLGFTNKVILK